MCGSRVLCDFLVNRARAFIYTTAPSPLAAASVREALKIVESEPERRAKLRELMKLANEQVVHRLGMPASGSQILPVVIGDVGRTVQIARLLQADGFDIRPIRPPTVPEGTARLRIAITLNVDAPMMTRLFDRLAEIMVKEAA